MLTKEAADDIAVLRAHAADLAAQMNAAAEKFDAEIVATLKPLNDELNETCTMLEQLGDRNWYTAVPRGGKYDDYLNFLYDAFQ